MRLIDADSLKYDLLTDNYDAKMTPQEVADCIDYQPTAYDAEKVVEQIKKSATDEDGLIVFDGKEPMIWKSKAIEIVRNGGVKHG